MKPIRPLYVVILIIIFAAAGFYGGMIYQKHHFRTSPGSAGKQYASRSVAKKSGAHGVIPVHGQISATGNNTITVKLHNGSSKIIDLTGQTKVNTITKGSASDLKTGSDVTAVGITNSDGSITARNITIVGL